MGSASETRVQSKQGRAAMQKQRKALNQPFGRREKTIARKLNDLVRVEASLMICRNGNYFIYRFADCQLASMAEIVSLSLFYVRASSSEYGVLTLGKNFF